MINKPNQIVDKFYQIAQIPRPSKHEERIRDYLIGWADINGLAHKVDTYGNLCIKVPAPEGKENLPSIVLQAHMDMVCVADEGYAYDKLCDPIDVYEEDSFLHARGTSLGSDNGIGLAMAMCAVDLDERPPLELLFTVEEETGLVGASHMSADLISSNYLLNLDNEANNELCIGMASIVQADVQVPLKYMNPPENYHFYTFSIQGLHGGHSGVDIHQPFGNAIILFFEILGSYEHSVYVATCSGGVANNAIPSSITSEIFIEDSELFHAHAARILANFKKSHTASGATVHLKPSESVEGTAVKNFDPLIKAILHYGSGIIDFDGRIDSTHTSSKNLGVCNMQDGILSLEYSARSYDDRKNAVFLEGLGDVFGADHAQGKVMGKSWTEDTDSGFVSGILASMKRVDERAYAGFIHAGLESGIFSNNIAGLSAASIGPYIYFPHSPNEKVYIPDIEKAWRYLVQILSDWGKDGLPE